MYEGEIKKFGDTVWIRKDPMITVRDYQKGQNLVNEQPSSIAQSLLIDHGKYWSFVSYDLDRVQTDLKGCLARWADIGSYVIAKAIDTDVLAVMAAGGAAANIGTAAGLTSASFNLGTDGSPRTVTKADINELFTDCATVLDEQNAPPTGRFLILAPSVAGLIAKSDLKNAMITGDATSIMRLGPDHLGQIAGFEVYKSTLLPYGTSSTTCPYCIFGNTEATTFATQLVEAKIQDDPFGFGQLHRGLHVYGRKVVKPEGLGAALVSISNI